MEFATLGTAKALHQVRLAATGPSKIEIEKTRRDKASEEQIDKLRPKPKKRSKVDKLRDRIKANNTTEVPAHKIKVPDYIARILTDQPILVKDFPELEQEAEDNYFAVKSQAFQDNMGSKVGIPRPIHVDFISKVVKEYTSKLEQEQSRRQQKASRKRLVKTEKYESKDDSCLQSSSPKLVEKRQKKNQNSSQKKRPATAGNQRLKNGSGDKPNPSDEDEKAFTLPSVIGEQRGRTPSRLEKKRVSFPHKASEGGKTGLGEKKGALRPSRGKSPQLLRKEALQKEREQAILNKIKEMEIRHRREEILKEIRSHQMPWLVIVSHLARVEFWKKMYTTEIRPLRARQARLKEANKVKFAVIFIEQWWFYKRISVLMKRNPEATFVLRGCIRRVWCRHQLNKRARGVAQLGMFLKDAKGSDKVKKLYAYRHKVIKMQRQFRMWFNMKEVRLQCLWRAMEVIGTARVESHYRAARAAERQALKAMSAAAGFDTTLRHIDTVSKGIEETLVRKEKEVKVRREEEAFEKAQAENTLQQKNNDDKKKANTPTVSSKKAVGGQSEKSSGKSSSRGKSKKQSMRWYFKMQMNPATKEKFEVIRELLHNERHRHVLDLVEAAKRNTHVMATGGKPPAVDMNSLKAFLLAAPGSEEEGNINLYVDEDASSGPIMSEKKPASDAKFIDFSAKHHTGNKKGHPPMHMGNAAGHHKVKHSHQHGHRPKVIHPRFNLFGYGILDYFRNCPLSFFKGVIEEYD